MASEPIATWRLVRALRADPPGRASEGARRTAFGAALEQSEQLWVASDGLSDAARPIVMFYGLAQAGVALLAARHQGDSWRAIRSHGLRLVQDDFPHQRTPTLSDFEVQDQGDGLFQQIATLMGSPTLPGPATLAALACSLPQARALLLRASDSMPLILYQHLDLTKGHENGDTETAWLEPFSEHLVPTEPTGRVTTDPTGHPSIEDVQQWLAPYPTLTGANAPRETAELWRRGSVMNSTPGIRLRWYLGRPMSPLRRRIWIADNLVSFAGEVARTDLAQGYVQPAVGRNPVAMHPLGSWWALLFGMSMLARYMPIEWVKLLNLDRSRDAESISHLLDTARDEIPRLILQRLRLPTSDPVP